MERGILDATINLVFHCGETGFQLGVKPEAVEHFRAWLNEELTFSGMITIFGQIMRETYHMPLNPRFVDLMTEINAVCFPVI